MEKNIDWLQKIFDEGVETELERRPEMSDTLWNCIKKDKLSRERIKKLPCFVQNAIWNFKYCRGEIGYSILFFLLTCIVAGAAYGHTVLPVGFSILYIILAVISWMRSILADEIDRGIATQILLLLSCLGTEISGVVMWFAIQ